MSLDTSTAGDPVHIPQRRDVFQFDNEVSSIFDNMAPRSIPLYNEVHRLHVSMFKDRLVPGAVVIDVGASTGKLFREIQRQKQIPFERTGIHGYALDASKYMLNRLCGNYPSVTAFTCDLADPFRLPLLPDKADLIVCLYTLQFIRPEAKRGVLAWLVDNTKVGGVLILGQKETVTHPKFSDLFRDEYYQFRRDNGYTQEEIDAKTEALKGAMWTVSDHELYCDLNEMGCDAVETSRWLQFSTLACVRNF